MEASTDSIPTTFTFREAQQLDVIVYSVKFDHVEVVEWHMMSVSSEYIHIALRVYNSSVTITSCVLQSVYNMLEGVNARPKDDPKDRAEAIFNKIDINNDGELNREEFLMGCQQDQEFMNLLNRQFNIISHGFGD